MMIKFSITQHGKPLSKSKYSWDEDTRTFSSEEDVSSDDNFWRELLWLHHGCSCAVLYGDDGEMQCNNSVAHFSIDFKRDSAEDIKSKLESR